MLMHQAVSVVIPFYVCVRAQENALTRWQLKNITSFQL